MTVKRVMFLTGAAVLLATIGAFERTAGANSAIQFTDATAAAGIRFPHNSGAFGKKYLPETMGSGAAFLDVDSDGWQDVFFVNRRNWPGRPGASAYPALYRNNRNGTFTDVTRAARAWRSRCMASASLPRTTTTTAIPTSTSRRSDPNRSVQKQRGRPVRGRDGPGGRRRPGILGERGLVRLRPRRPARSVRRQLRGVVDRARIGFCSLDGKTKSYCTPESYKGQSPTLYRNTGDGTFENVTTQGGPARSGSEDARRCADRLTTTTACSTCFAANDTQPNRLYRNKGDGTFADVAVMAGVAFNEAGKARAGMGVDAADYDGSGRQSLVIGNFSNEMMALYANQGNGLFIDEAPNSTIGRASLLRLTFACFFFDFDLDGLLDIFAANGHVADDIATVQPTIAYAAAAASLPQSRVGRSSRIVSTRVGDGVRQSRQSRAAPRTATTTTTAISICS